MLIFMLFLAILFVALCGGYGVEIFIAVGGFVLLMIVALLMCCKSQEVDDGISCDKCSDKLFCSGRLCCGQTGIRGITSRGQVWVSNVLNVVRQLPGRVQYTLNIPTVNTKDISVKYVSSNVSATRNGDLPGRAYTDLSGMWMRIPLEVYVQSAVKIL